MESHPQRSKTKIAKLGLGTETFKNIPSFAIDLAFFEKLVGHETDAILGFDVFSRYVVEVDYKERFLRLYDPDHYSDSGDGCKLPFISRYVCSRSRSNCGWICEPDRDRIRVGHRIQLFGDYKYVCWHPPGPSFKRQNHQCTHEKDAKRNCEISRRSGPRDQIGILRRRLSNNSPLSRPEGAGRR